MKKVYLLGYLLLGILPIWGQVEINVKVKPGAGSLQDYFYAQSEVAVDIPIAQRALARPNEIPASFLSTLPLVRTVHLEEIQQVFTLKFDAADPQAIIQSLRASGQFEFVEENHTFQLDAIQYIPNDDSLSGQWYLPYIQAFRAWDIERGSPQVKIGVLDTGLDFLHPDFQGQVAINALEDINGNGTFEPWPATEVRNGLSGDFDGIDGDNNGYTDDVAGYDFTDQPRSPFGGDYLVEDPDPTDDNTHGTVVTGVISAKANNNEGIAGLAHNCKLVPIRAFAASGGGEDDDIARAIIYAVDNGIQVLNFSFGDIYASKIMHEAIKYAYDKGVVMVSSAGNGTGDELHYPSGYNEVISVSASTANLSTGFESLWPLSSFGVTVDLCAPGADILTTTVMDTSISGEVTYLTRTQGTSLSAPLVSATAALLLSQRGPLTPQQIRGILTTTVDDISSPGWDHFTGAGRLNVAKALEAAGTSVVSITSPVSDNGSAENQVWITGSVLDPEFAQYHVEYMKGIADTSRWEPIIENQPYQVREDTLGMWDLSGLPTGDYTLRIRLEKTDGFTQEDRIRFVRDTTAPQIEWTRAVPEAMTSGPRMTWAFRVC
ncbi:MAG: S8 family serine peptidase [Bacteroidota bacterium]